MTMIRMPVERWMAAGLAALAVTLSVTLPALAAPASGSQCDVRVHFTVNHAGNESIGVTGQCAGHAPTARDLKRLASPLVTPAYLETQTATARQLRRWHLAGPCQITRFRRHGGFTVMCRDGQYRLFAGEPADNGPALPATSAQWRHTPLMVTCPRGSQPYGTRCIAD